jgi:hypothetical protein
MAHGAAGIRGYAAMKSVSRDKRDFFAGGKNK